MAKRKKEESAMEALKHAADDQSKATYVLTLYVAGMTRRSAAAIQDVKQFCEENLKGRYELQVIDIYRHPELAHEKQIIAAPTLIKSLPLPLKRLIGDMANRDKVLVGLDVKPMDGDEKNEQ